MNATEIKSENSAESAAEKMLAASVWTYKGTPVRDMLAFPSTIAAKLLGISYTTFWFECSLGKIRRTHLKTVPRAELLRYLDAALPPLAKKISPKN